MIYKNLQLLILLLALSVGTVANAQAGKPVSLEQMRQDLAKINKSIDETKNKIKDVRDARFLPELYFALAEFYVDKSRYMYAIKVAENSSTPAEELDFSAEKRPKLQAIEVYDTLIEKFPTLPELDKAIFFKAHEQRELGRLEDMIKTYGRLTKDYPNSDYWSEAQVIIGDYFFEEKKDVDFAITIYQKLLARPPGPYTPLANYKLGWCYINKNDFKKSLDFFEKVLFQNKDVDLTQLPESYRKTDVRREALLAMVWPYSEISSEEMAKIGAWRVNPLEYFHRVAPDPVSYEKVLARLAKRLSLKMRLVEATKVDFELLRISNDLEVRMDVIERLYVNMKNTQKPWPVRGLVQEIAKTLPRVKGSPDLKEAEKKKAEHDWEIFARDVATREQKRARSTRAKSDWDWVIRDYNDYLLTFPNSRYAQTLRLNLAESYFNSGQLAMAGKTYEEIARLTKDNKKKQEFLESAIQAYIGAIRNQSELSRLELAEVRSGLRDVGSQFVKAFPKNKASEDIRFNIAQTYYDERNFDLAVNRFKEFITLYPSSAKVSVAANLILDSYHQREDYLGLVREGKGLLAKSIKDPSLREQISEIIQQAEMRGVQAQAGEYGSKEYASNLLKLASKYKGSSLGDQALYEAFISLKAKKDPKAYETGEQLALQHSKSKYAQEVVTAMGQMALASADFRRAALYFELFHERYPTNPQARELLKNAAQMRELMGDFKIAASDYQKLGDNDAAAKQNFLAGDWSGLLRLAPRAQGIHSVYWEGLANYRLRGIGPARPSLEKAAAISSNQYDEQEMAAHSIYLLAMGAMENYKKIELRTGHEAKDVADKLGNFKELDGKLKRAIAFGNGRWTIAALYGLGQANLEFARFILKAPVPRGLSSGQETQYKQALETQAKTYKQAAADYFKKCMENAEKFEIFTQFALGCQAQGTLEVDEAKETLIQARARESDPPGVREIQLKLLDQPRNVELLSDLAEQYLKAQDYSMAELVLNRALEIEKDNPKVTARLGTVKMFKGDNASAKDWFKKTLTKQKNNSNSLWGLAGLYNHFQFKGRLKEVLAKAKSSGQPSQTQHPYVREII